MFETTHKHPVKTTFMYCALKTSSRAEKLKLILTIQQFWVNPDTIFSCFHSYPWLGLNFCVFCSCRWVKFEEKVEEGGERWSKPHVSTLSLHSLFELRTCLQTGTVLLDMEGYSLPQIVGEMWLYFDCTSHL